MGKHPIFTTSSSVERLDIIHKSYPQIVHKMLITGVKRRIYEGLLTFIMWKTCGYIEVFHKNCG